MIIACVVVVVVAATAVLLLLPIFSMIQWDTAPVLKVACCTMRLILREMNCNKVLKITASHSQIVNFAVKPAPSVIEFLPLITYNIT